ncbi:MAG: LysM peptidoglycan-binding domain-containing protein [Betaproteobacteria bacterium]|nr:LysM peptidoglycan-binding domain-containing protein [Betaproteobacteria bacterium]
MNRASVDVMTGESVSMQGPITSSISQPTWQSEDRRRSAQVTDPFRSGGGFGQALRVATGARHAPNKTSDYEIQSGDTLSGIAQRRLQELGLPASGADIGRAVEQLAASNSIRDPNRIFAGDRISLQGLERSPAPQPPRVALPPAPVARVTAAGGGAVMASAQPPLTARPAGNPSASATFPQLQRTLDRAVERGYVDPTERQTVQDKIVEISRRFKFSPDDFATVALMESDGLDPRASNGRCHGILQFCEGPGRGAESVGMLGRASEIRDKSVLAQLGLVEKYFEDTRLGAAGPVSLVDLYLTVLTPAARSEQRPHAALDIAGRQAKALHVSGDRSQPITRQSIFSGLIGHAQQRLEALTKSRPALEARSNEGTVQSVRPGRQG